jgi:hypothetical protein
MSGIPSKHEVEGQDKFICPFCEEGTKPDDSFIADDGPGSKDFAILSRDSKENWDASSIHGIVFKHFTVRTKIETIK